MPIEVYKKRCKSRDRTSTIIVDLQAMTDLDENLMGWIPFESDPPLLQDAIRAPTRRNVEHTILLSCYQTIITIWVYRTPNHILVTVSSRKGERMCLFLVLVQDLELHLPGSLHVKEPLFVS